MTNKKQILWVSPLLIIGLIVALLFVGCDNLFSDDDAEDDTEQSENGKKDNVFITLNNEKDEEHIITQINFDTYTGSAVIEAVQLYGDYFNYPFRGTVNNDTNNSIMQIKIVYEDYDVGNYINWEIQDRSGYPPVTPAQTCILLIKSASEDSVLFAIEDDKLDYVKINSIEFIKPSWRDVAYIGSDDVENMSKETYGYYYYYPYYMRQFFNIFNFFKQYAKEASILRINIDLKDTTDISDLYLSHDWYNSTLPYDSINNGLNKDSLDANFKSWLRFLNQNEIIVLEGYFNVNLTEINEKVDLDELENAGITVNSEKYSFPLILP